MFFKTILIQFKFKKKKCTPWVEPAPASDIKYAHIYM